jgi:hypothetical protein
MSSAKEEIAKITAELKSVTKSKTEMKKQARMEAKKAQKAAPSDKDVMKESDIPFEVIGIILHKSNTKNRRKM